MTDTASRRHTTTQRAQLLVCSAFVWLLLGIGPVLVPEADASKRCKAFRYAPPAEGIADPPVYRFTHLRVSGARCSVIKKVVVGYFNDRGEPAGSGHAEGYNVFGWNVLLNNGLIDGRRRSGAGRFSGRFLYQGS